jgi:hypothetical protein
VPGKRQVKVFILGNTNTKPAPEFTTPEDATSTQDAGDASITKH